MLVAALLAGGCGGGNSVRKEAAGADGRRPELAQAIEELRREVVELTLRLQAYRSVQQEELAGVRAEVRAVRAAVEALVRDVDQRHLEAREGLERRLAALEARIAELAAASQPGAVTPAERGTPPGGPGR